MTRCSSRPFLTSICLLAALLALAGARPAMAAETGFVPALGQNVNGPQKAADLGVGWVRLFLNWKDAEPADNAFNAGYIGAVARDIAAYRAAGAKVLVVVTGSPQWASGSATGIGAPEPAQYAAFIDHVMLAAPGVGAWEI